MSTTGDGANGGDRERIVRAIEDAPEVEGLLSLTTAPLGDEGLLVAARVAVPADRPLSELVADLDRVEARIRTAVPVVGTVVLQPDVRPEPRTPPPTEAIVVLSVD